MTEESKILNRLLDKYETSTSYRTGHTDRRVLLNVANDAELMRHLDHETEKQLFLTAINNLKDAEVIDYDWVKHEEGNLVHWIWLNLEPESIAKAYKLAERKPGKEKIQQLLDTINDTADKMDSQSDLTLFLNAMTAYISEKHSIPRYFTGDMDTDVNLLVFLQMMSENQTEQMERIISTSLYHDSKYFEHVLKPKVLSVLRHIAKETSQDSETDDNDLLQQRGIVRWPEIMEFTGNVTVILKDGSTADYSSQQYGAYINSRMIEQIDHVILHDVHRILFIENKANYVSYSYTKKQSDELVLYHGGCYSPIKGKWFQLIHQAAETDTAFYHWSDIDAGGFRIYTRLKDQIVAELQPYCMDVQTLRQYEKQCIPLGTESYRKLLKQMLEDEQYAVFHDVINYMLEHNIKLEQENQII